MDVTHEGGQGNTQDRDGGDPRDDSCAAGLGITSPKRRSPDCFSRDFFQKMTPAGNLTHLTVLSSTPFEGWFGDESVINIEKAKETPK